MSNLIPETQHLPGPDSRPSYLRRSFGPVVLLVVIGLAVYFGGGYLSRIVPPSDARVNQELTDLRQENRQLKLELSELRMAIQKLRDRAARAEMLAELRESDRGRPPKVD